MNQIDFTDTSKISQLFKQAVDKALENHRKKGESIAVSDEMNSTLQQYIG